MKSKITEKLSWMISKFTLQKLRLKLQNNFVENFNLEDLDVRKINQNYFANVMG